ncbi:MAG: type II toxin-antitoxin system RelE/ParE family toxin [Lysobacterales bacterium]
MQRCRQFLVAKHPKAAQRAGLSIEHQFALLEADPNIGRPLDNLPELRELVMPFGESGYVALYRHDVQADLVYILAIRHQKEAGYLQS